MAIHTVGTSSDPEKILFIPGRIIMSYLGVLCVCKSLLSDKTKTTVQLASSSLRGNHED